MDDLLLFTPNGRWTAFVEEFLARPLHLGIREVSYMGVTLSLGQEKFLQTSVAQPPLCGAIVSNIACFLLTKIEARMMRLSR